MDKIIINGNGAVRVDGRYIHYKHGEPVRLPESVAKSTGKEYKVIERYQTTVVSKDDSENRESDERFLNLPDDTAFPHHYGGGNYYLSNGETVSGKENAIKAQSEIES